MQRKKKSAVKSKKLKSAGKNLVQADQASHEPAPPRRMDKAKRRRIDELYRSIGWQVDSYGEASRAFYSPGTPVRVLNPDSSPSMGEELLVKIDRSLRDMREDGPIPQYDKIMEILLDWMKRQGPLRPSEYNQVYTELNLRDLYNQIYNPGGKFPQLTCCECGRLLGERQKKYCSLTCRQASKTKRQREKHPEYKARR